MEKLKCKICGQVITDHGIKYCPSCRKKRKEARKQKKREERVPNYKQGYRALADAIISQALKDLSIKKYRAEVMEFFFSERFKDFTGIDGQKMVKELRRAKYDRDITGVEYQEKILGESTKTD